MDKEMTYEDWVKFGANKDYIRRFIKDREENLIEVKKKLEQAFTPEIKSMLDKKIRDEIEGG